MHNENELKQRLQALAQKKFKTNDQNTIAKLIPSMLAHIGSTDPELRDELIYIAFIRWSMSHKAISPEKLREIFNILLDDEHLFFRCGETETDSIFTRSFSALWLPPILIAHREDPFLTHDDVQNAHEALLRYLDEEKDHRGFVEGKGWAHAIAHAADALDDLAQCPEIGADELGEMLPVIQQIICMTDFVYAYGEDERMVTPVLAIIRRGLLPNDKISNWLEGFVKSVSEAKTMPAGVILRANVQNFLQSLYFRLKWSDEKNLLLSAIEKTLRNINTFTQ